MIWWKSQRLKSGNPKIRLRMLEQLAAVGDPSLIESLAAALNDPVADNRATAARLLGTVQDERALPALAPALKDKTPEVRLAAVNSLRQSPDPRAKESLVVALEDTHHAVRWQAATALNALGWRPTHDTEFIRHAVAVGNHEQAAVHGNVATGYLINALKDPACPRRHAAAIALGKTGNAQA